MCIGCKQRGTTCRSQEFDDENAPEPGQKPDPPIARRLDRLEQMMERLVDKIVPDEAGASAPSASQQHEIRRSHSGSSSSGPSPRRRESSIDILEASAATSEGPIAALLAMRHESVHRRGPSESGHIPTPALTSAEPSTPTLPITATPQGTESRPVTSLGGQTFPPLHKHFWTCNTLRSVIPPPSALDAIITASPGASYVVSLCYSDAERRQGRIEPTSSIAVTPSVSAHPLRLAKKALQILICLQQLPPTFDWDSLNVGGPMTETMARLLNSAILVTSNDDLVGYAEGIECLILQGCYHANSGNLRKAWALARRALALAQMMGFDKCPSNAFRSCDPSADPRHGTSADVLWWKIVHWERSLSLLLGLSAGSQGNEFASARACEQDTPIDRLEKAHAVLSARISGRNDNHHRNPARHQANYALTQEIDLELEAATKAMPPGWWNDETPPRPHPSAPQEALWDANADANAAARTLLLQIEHHTLLLLLHAPYMLRDPASPRYDYSKATCASAARDLLARFLALRGGAHATAATATCCCRRADYAALLAAMTLCLSYLGRRRTEPAWDTSRIRADAEVVEGARRCLERVARANANGGDRLAREAVGIIEQLARIVDAALATWLRAGEGEGRDVARRASETFVGRDSEREGDRERELRFSVPYLGSIHIKIPSGLTTSPSSSSLFYPPPTDRRGSSGGGGGGATHHRRHPSSATSALERMALSPSWIVSPTPAPAPLHEAPALEAGLVRLTPYDEPASSGAGGDGIGGTEPDLMAGAEEWALQGVDAAFWSLFEGTS